MDAQHLDDHIRGGRRHALAALDMIEKGYGEENAMAYAGGMIAGVRLYLLGKYGPRKTFDLFAGMADDVITPELPHAEGRSA